MNAGGKTMEATFLGGDRLLLIKEAAENLRVSDKTIRRFIVAGKLLSVKVGGKRLVPVSALNALVSGGRA